MPEHHMAMKSKVWNGYVYEHIVVVEKDHNTKLKDGEQVHHLDLDKSNNDPKNLIIISVKSHRKIHNWIKYGAPISKVVIKHKNHENYIAKKCIVCNKKALINKQKITCSVECYDIHLKNTKKGNSINIDEVIGKLKRASFVKISKEYGLSDNGLRKVLLKRLNITKEELKSLIKI
jgi:hypothetical protein